jgi:hypothetical protein
MRKLDIKDADIMRLSVKQEIQRSEESLLGCSQSLLDGKLLSHHLPQQFGVAIGVRQCRRIFYQLRFRRRKPRPIIAHADPLTQLILKHLRRLTLRDDIDHWFEDKCHFQQHGSRCALWVPAEEIDPVLLNMPTRKNIAY